MNDTFSPPLKTPTDPAAANGVLPAEFNALNPLLQHHGRLGILVLLCTVDALSFARLRAALSETDGNLGAQLKKLEEAQYVSVKKEFVDRKPVSWYAITPAGRTAIKTHLAAVEGLLKLSRGS